MFDHLPKPENAVMKILQDMYSRKETSFILYTNDAKVLIDILLRHLIDLSPGDEVCIPFTLYPSFTYFLLGNYMTSCLATILLQHISLRTFFENEGKIFKKFKKWKLSKLNEFPQNLQCSKINGAMHKLLVGECLTGA